MFAPGQLAGIALRKHLLKYDTVHGVYPGAVGATNWQSERVQVMQVGDSAHVAGYDFSQVVWIAASVVSLPCTQYLRFSG